MSGATIQPVILCGGRGKRLWPLSRRDNTKPFLSLTGDQSLFEKTLSRVRDRKIFSPPIIVSGAAQKDDILHILHKTGAAATMLIEPTGRNTAPALAAACMMLAEEERGDTPVLLMPADHEINPGLKFVDAVTAARESADTGHFVLFGIEPERPASKFGYIVPADGKDKPAPVAAFVEKPPQETAKKLINERGAFWNSGIFLLKANDFLTALEAATDTISAPVERAWAKRDTITAGDKDNVRIITLGKDFGSAQDISIDHAVMEGADNAVVYPAPFDWSDMGSWEALWRVSKEGAEHVARVGQVVAEHCRDSYFYSDGPVICALGLEDLAVVATDDAVFVGPLAGSTDLNAMLNKVQAQHPDLMDRSLSKDYGWGQRKILADGSNYMIIRYRLEPGGRLPDKFIEAGQWSVTAGSARTEHVVNGEKQTRALYKGQAIFVNEAVLAGVENTGDDVLEMIHVKAGRD